MIDYKAVIDRLQDMLVVPERGGDFEKDVYEFKAVLENALQDGWDRQIRFTILWESLYEICYKEAELNPYGTIDTQQVLDLLASTSE